MKKLSTAIIAFLLGFALSGSAIAGPYEEGVAAIESGKFDSGIEILLPLAEEGDALAQIAVAEGYIRRRGYNDDTREAEKWLRLAAEQGYAQAQYGLGWIYSLPLYGENYSDAMKWYRLAAEQGYAPAQVAVGQLFARGFGIPRDREEAFRWYKLAADQGNVEAYLELSSYYRRGKAKNLPEAVKWLRLAVEQGRGFAMLAHMYREGEGVPQDNVQAYMWFELAFTQGDKSSAIYRDMVAAKMTQEQIAEAQHLAQEWTAGHPQ